MGARTTGHTGRLSLLLRIILLFSSSLFILPACADTFFYSWYFSAIYAVCKEVFKCFSRQPPEYLLKPEMHPIYYIRTSFPSHAAIFAVLPHNMISLPYPDTRQVQDTFCSRPLSSLFFQILHHWFFYHFLYFLNINVKGNQLFQRHPIQNGKLLCLLNIRQRFARFIVIFTISQPAPRFHALLLFLSNPVFSARPSPYFRLGVRQSAPALPKMPRQ